MPRTIDESLLPRPAQFLDTPALAQATRRAAERLQDEFRLSPEGAEALAAAVVDPAEVRKAADNPERLYVPGGAILGLRTRVWARRVMPDPRNPRVGPVRRHPIAVAPGSTEDSRFRPIPDPEAGPDGRPELQLRIASREHLSWASGIAKKYILKDNDWRLSIRNQGVMTEVWLSAMTLVDEGGGVPVTVPVTSEGSSRVTACHDILDIRSADVPYSRDDRALRSIIRSLNDAYTNGASVEQDEALRCETVPALLLVGFEPNPGSTSATFATAVRSLVALRHVDPPKPWDEGAKMEAIADAVLEALTSDGLITPAEQSWLSGALTPDEAADQRFSPDPAVRAARIVRLLTDSDPSVHHAVRMAITSQSTRQRVRNKFKLEVAAALIMRSVTSPGESDKVTDIHRALKDGFSEPLAAECWQATYRSTEELTAAALDETSNGAAGPNSLELAARAAYPLIVSRQLFSDRGTKDNNQVDRRKPGLVIDRMRTNPWGVRQLSQALADHAAGRKVRAVAHDGSPIPLAEGPGDQAVSDNWLRRTFPPPGTPVAPAAPETAHERLMEALSHFGQAMEALTKAARDLAGVEGLDGRHLIDTEGMDPADADAWWAELMRVAQQLPVWKATHLGTHGRSPGFAAPWADAEDDAEDDAEVDHDVDEDEELEGSATT